MTWHAWLPVPRLLLLAWLMVGVCRPGAPAETFDVILCGNGGTDEYEELFHSWGVRLHDVLVDRLEHSADHVYLLMEKRAEPEPNTSAISLDTIESVFDELSGTASIEDDVYIYLIGHGSYLARISKFHIPGPDLTAPRLRSLLDKLTVQRTVVVVSTSSSAGFINDLTAQDRVICTATKSVEERNATQFMEFFIQGLEEGSADLNRDTRISLLEACQQAAALTEAGYTGDGLIATEHSLLDDNGDGRGTRLPIAETPAVEESASQESGEPQADGGIAAQIYIKDFTFPSSVPKEIVREYLDRLAEVEHLKTMKSTMDSDEYYAELERLLTAAAKANRRIHQHAAKDSE